MNPPPAAPGHGSSRSQNLAHMYWACADVLSLAGELASARDLPSTDVLQRRIAGLFDQMWRRCAEWGIPNEDALEAKYAIAAFADEQILRSAWPGRAQWFSQPLQLVYFNENTAGEGFFRRMAMIQNQPHRLHVLQIYYLCLCLGFQGQYAVYGANALAPIIEQIGARLGAEAGGDSISPHAEPQERYRGLVYQDAPLVALGVALLGVALAVFFVLKLAVAVTASSAARDLRSSAAAVIGEPSGAASAPLQPR